MRNGRGGSTRELAEIAGATLKTVRHYHRIGLLAEPERATNGSSDEGAEQTFRALDAELAASSGSARNWRASCGSWRRRARRAGAAPLVGLPPGGRGAVARP
ncbi:MerR family DNA-binding transcriptional regulator [Micromonospora sp. NPDC018662]|uniref:MerR family DNA-binding transcriptional regulator n=1 Tax=Micromonospora sp. NPDC018662 TaxID=3364238 RepID=UPI0037BC5A13